MTLFRRRPLRLAASSKPQPDRCRLGRQPAVPFGCSPRGKPDTKAGTHSVPCRSKLINADCGNIYRLLAAVRPSVGGRAGRTFCTAARYLSRRCIARRGETEGALFFRMLSNVPRRVGGDGAFFRAHAWRRPRPSRGKGMSLPCRILPADASTHRLPPLLITACPAFVSARPKAMGNFPQRAGMRRARSAARQWTAHRLRLRARVADAKKVCGISACYGRHTARCNHAT